jgi:hypothetical protein
MEMQPSPAGQGPTGSGDARTFNVSWDPAGTGW